MPGNGHLKFKGTALPVVILASWGIAFIEYCLAVPANRMGSAVYSTAELKTIQEVITLLVFAAFSVLYLGERINAQPRHRFALICAGAWFVFQADKLPGEPVSSPCGGLRPAGQGC